MNGGHTLTDGPDCSLDAAAYVLGALEPNEAEAFRAHLEGCAACREEVAALQPVADALPAAAPAVAVPPDLRRRVLDAVHDEQRAEAAVRMPSAAPAKRRPERRPERARRRPLFGPSGLAAGFGGGFAVAAAAAAVVLIATGGSSPSQVIQAQVTGSGAAHLVVAHGRAELVVNHFPAAGHGRIYQVWLKRPNHAPAPTRTLFNVTTGGGGEVGVGGSLHGVNEVLVTAEPLGGSPVPTTAPVITAHL